MSSEGTPEPWAPNPTINQAERLCKIVIEALSMLGIDDSEKLRVVANRLWDLSVEGMLLVIIDADGKIRSESGS